MKLLSRAFQWTCTADQAIADQLTIPLNKLPCSNSTPEPDPEIKGPDVQKQPEIFFDDLPEKYIPEVVSIDDNDSDQGYRKRYNLIDCGHKKQFLCVLNKKTCRNVSTGATGTTTIAPNPIPTGRFCSLSQRLHQTFPCGYISDTIVQIGQTCSNQRPLLISQKIQLPFGLSIILYLFLQP